MHFFITRPADHPADPAIRASLLRTLLTVFILILKAEAQAGDFYGPWIESFQDCWWDPEFPQLSQMIQSLPGFLNLCLNVCSPSQVLGDVYTEVLEVAHLLHRFPTHACGVRSITMHCASWPIRADYACRKEGLCRKRSVWERQGIEDLQ